MPGILVTGAGGFIGGHVVRYLADNEGLRVVASTRDGRDGSRRLDLLDPTSFSASLNGISAIVHCAAGNWAVTVEGTRALLKAAALAGVRRFVYLSSVAVYATASGVVFEESPLISARGRGYDASKLAAEQLCLAQLGLETVRLRPTIVYGSGGEQWVGAFVRRIRAGRWGVFGKTGEGICNPVHVFDVASAIAASLKSAKAIGQVFNVNGPEVITWNAWFARLASEMGLPPLKEVSPYGVQARAYAALPVKAVARLRPNFAREWLRNAPSHRDLDLFARKATYSVDRARDILGWKPLMSIDAGLGETVEWLRSQD